MSIVLKKYFKKKTSRQTAQFDNSTKKLSRINESKYKYDNEKSFY